VQNIFTVEEFQFPYKYKFPGQSSDEHILYVTREHPIIHVFRQCMIIVSSGFVFGCCFFLGQMLASFAGPSFGGLIQVGGAIIALLFLVIGWWWVSVLWKKSIAVITTKRLVKFIYTTPWNRHNLSLPLDMVVDTGAYSKGWLQALFKLGTFTARSSAASSGVATDDPDRVNKKYFYIENLGNAEDIHHYLSKVLFVFRQDWKKLENFRPFLPHLKGDARKEFMKQYPEYWS
jgi:hypothetical protein